MNASVCMCWWLYVGEWGCGYMFTGDSSGANVLLMGRLDILSWCTIATYCFNLHSNENMNFVSSFGTVAVRKASDRGKRWDAQYNNVCTKRRRKGQKE